MTYVLGQDYSNSYPYTATVFVQSTFADGSVASGSGVMVGPNDVLTAAHMLWDADTGAATSVTVFPGYNDGNIPFGAIAGAQWSYYQWDFLGADGQPGHDDMAFPSESQWDVGVIGLSTNVGYQTGWMGIDPGGYSDYYFETGYPADEWINGVPQLSLDYGYAAYDPNYWTYDYQDGFSISPGNSGGPLWYMGADGFPYVIGICSTGVSAADVGFTFDTIQAWMNNDYLLV